MECMMPFYEFLLNMFSKSVTVYVAWLYHCSVQVSSLVKCHFKCSYVGELLHISNIIWLWYAVKILGAVHGRFKQWWTRNVVSITKPWFFNFTQQCIALNVCINVLHYLGNFTVQKQYSDMLLENRIHHYKSNTVFHTIRLDFWFLDIWLIISRTMHAISTHNTSKWSLIFTESFDTNVNTSRDNHMTQHDSKQQCVCLKL